MLALGDLWVILGTACLLLALEMIWFSSIGFGSWLNQVTPDVLERYSLKRLIVSLVAFITISSVVFFGLSLGLMWWELLLIGSGLIFATAFSVLPRRPLPLKPLLAELGFVLLLLLVTTYVIAAWPW